MIRPIRPEDEPALKSWFAELTPEESQMRFFAPIKTLSHVAAVRFTQLDYEREMAFVLAEPGRAGRVARFGVTTLMIDPSETSAEYRSWFIMR